MADLQHVPTEPVLAPDEPIRVKREGQDATGQKSWHRHPEGQFFAVTSGLIVVETEVENWMVPRGRIGWMPPGVAHAARVHGHMTGWTGYLSSKRCTTIPKRPGLFGLTGLMAEVIDRLATSATPAAYDGPFGRLIDIFVDELAAAPDEALRLPMPVSAPLRSVALSIIDAPDADRSLAEWAREISMSPRNLTRRFMDETALSIGQWRHLARMTRALELLVEGMPVTEVAMAVGYTSVSAFITLFRRTFGTTPARYRTVDRARP